MPSGSVQCVVTSPPFWGLRDYSRCGCATDVSLRSHSTLGVDVMGNDHHATQGNLGPDDKRCKKDPDPNCPICKGTGIIQGVKEHQLGLEKTPEEYVQHLVGVFREVKRVLRDDGTLWLNLGDCYASGHGERGSFNGTSPKHSGVWEGLEKPDYGLKSKDLVGIRTGIGVKEGPLDRYSDEETTEEDTGEGKMTETDG